MEDTDGVDPSHLFSQPRPLFMNYKSIFLLSVYHLIILSIAKFI